MTVRQLVAVSGCIGEAVDVDLGHEVDGEVDREPVGTERSEPFHITDTGVETAGDHYETAYETGQILCVAMTLSDRG